jgi:hypothetical protein
VVMFLVVKGSAARAARVSPRLNIPVGHERE